MRTKLLRTLTVGFLLAVVLTAFSASPALAATIDDPDDMQVLATYVYEGCLETGDAGVLIYYLIDYTVIPPETATEAFLFILIDTDGTTQLKAVAPYTFVDSGYGYGMAWIYFTATEATTAGLDSADVDLYSVLLTGNPTVPAGWTGGDPPSVSAGIDYWQTIGDTSTLVALRVLYYADQLELLWGLDIIASTPLGNKLAALGEEYFRNVIPGLQAIAPSAFSSSSYDPLNPNPDYTMEFGGTVTSGEATVVGSPVTLVEGANTITIGALGATGTFTIELENGTTGTATEGTATIAGSPVDLVSGTNTLTATVIGTVVVDVGLTDTQAAITDTITGTGWDLTDLATLFHMSRLWMSTVVWMLATLLVCAAVYKVTTRRGPAPGTSKVVFFVFSAMFYGGVVLAMVPMLGGVLLFLGCDLFIGYIAFYKPANI